MVSLCSYLCVLASSDAGNPGYYSGFFDKTGKEKRGELESIRRNNYAKHLCRLIEIDKTEILDNMRDRFNPVVQIFFRRRRLNV